MVLTSSSYNRAGVTRERLEGFDRKITGEPQDFADKRGALIADFQHYLGIIKAVHEGADLQVHRLFSARRNIDCTYPCFTQPAAQQSELVDAAV